MIGALIGDITGSIYEFNNGPKSKEFKLWQKDMQYTDDSVLTIAVMEVLLRHIPIDYSETNLEIIKKDLVDTFIRYVVKYPHCGWGNSFYNWAIRSSNHTPYGSWGNGSAMRISPVGWMANSEQEVKLLSKAVTEITHNSSEGILGAEATAMCIYLARTGKDKDYIRNYVIKHYYKDIVGMDYIDLVNNYIFDVSTSGTVPVAIFAFLISNSFEDCLRTCISIGGDADTLACISCSIAEAYYGVSDSFRNEAFKKLPLEFINIVKLLDERIMKI